MSSHHQERLRPYGSSKSLMRLRHRWRKNRNHLEKRICRSENAYLLIARCIAYVRTARRLIECVRNSKVSGVDLTRDVALPRKGMLRGATSESAESRPRRMRDVCIVPLKSSISAYL